MIWFSSDYHIGHKNIIEHAKRPFDNIEEMAETIVARHNEVVKKGDIIYLVGDTFWQRTVGFEQAGKFLRRLNGTRWLMEGNHDDELVYQLVPHAKQMHEVKWDGHKIVACHYPMLSWPGSFHGSTTVHGHTHQKHQLTLPPKKIIHIGVDSWDFRPVSAEQIVVLAATLENNDT